MVFQKYSGTSVKKNISVDRTKKSINGHFLALLMSFL
jgi:hypothetical protein